MKPTKVHIVCFDVPYPADYGGAIDVFYKIKNLYTAGCKIYLHCFEYGRGLQPELNKYCEEVWYYPRITGLGGISTSIPYIVYSRRNKTLISRLASIDAPILFEGIHSTYYLSHPILKDRFKILRIHNIEHEYYLQLAQKENNLLKKTYFLHESSLLEKYEHNLSSANAFCALSMADHDYFKELYPFAHHNFIVPFHPYNEVVSLIGQGDYCLYHGNLSHPENREAVFYLLKEIIPNLSCKVIIAGRQPAPDIVTAVKSTANCQLIINPTSEELESLIQNAQINLLPTFQKSGMKLKLLYALFAGRHAVANRSMLHGTGLSDICPITDNSSEMIEKINSLFLFPFTTQDIEQRKQKLANYSNHNNALLLKQLLLGN